MKNLGTLIFVAFLMPALATGAVLRVEKDGSGDFTVIQDAVDAAQDGDTIQIGPGRFGETHDFNYYGTTIQVCVTLDKSLSIIGAGRGVTFIDPTGNGRNEYDDGGLASRSSELEVTLADLTIANCPGHGLLFDMLTGGRIEVARVDVENCYSGINILGTFNSHVQDCNINTTVDRGLFARWADDILIENCRLIGGAGLVHLYSTRNGQVTNCRVENAADGFILQYCEGVSVSHCQALDMEYNGLIVDSSQDIQISDVEVMGHSYGGLVLSSVTNLEITNSLFQAGGATLKYEFPCPGLVFHGNHILPSDDGISVRTYSNYSGPAWSVDLTDNFWGTDDSEQVAEWIIDGNDDPSIHIFIDYLPMAGGPMGTDRTTLDGLKALYR